MAHCMVALESAGRFEKENGIDWELVCMDRNASQEIGLNLAKNKIDNKS